MSMEKRVFEIEITIDAPVDIVTANISIVQGKEPIVAFVQLDFGFITVKGCTVKKRDFKNDGNETLIFDLPAYKAGYTFIKSVFISDKRIYSAIAQGVLRKVEEEQGMITNSEETVDVDDIPF